VTLLVGPLVLLLLVAGCAGGSAAREPGGGAADGEVTGTLTVLAAASLTESFTELAERFESDHPGAAVRLSFGASSELAAQVDQGAPADVFAAASPETMALAVDAGAVRGEPRVFARNRLEIAVPPGNPGGVTGLADLAREELKVALCAPEVPCGSVAETVLRAAGVTPAPDTLEADVKATLTKVTLGEVDAALVYRTDVLAAGDAVRGIEFPEADRAVNDYLLAVLTGAPNPGAAQAFADLVRSRPGRAVLTEAGFDAP
jgi:molybdate transport system substrate-binding protein